MKNEDWIKKQTPWWPETNAGYNYANPTSSNSLLLNKIDYILTPTIANTPYNAIIT